jgi:hypothetical protein
MIVNNVDKDRKKSNVEIKFLSIDVAIKKASMIRDSESNKDSDSSRKIVYFCGKRASSSPILLGFMLSFIKLC